MLTQPGEQRLRMLASKQHVVSYMVDQLHIDPAKAEGIEAVLYALGDACRETAHVLNEIVSELTPGMVGPWRFYFE